MHTDDHSPDDRVDPAPEASPSVLDHVAAAAGVRPTVSLPDIDSDGQAPLLRPLRPDDPLARKFGRYVIHGVIGQGGVGSCTAATTPTWGVMSR